MNVYIGLRAPYILSTEQRAQLQNDEIIVECKRLKILYLKQIQSKFGSLRKAQGSELHCKYDRARLDLKAKEKL